MKELKFQLAIAELMEVTYFLKQTQITSSQNHIMIL